MGRSKGWPPSPTWGSCRDASQRRASGGSSAVPVGADPVGEVEVGVHQDAEQPGAWSAAQASGRLGPPSEVIWPRVSVAYPCDEDIGQYEAACYSPGRSKPSRVFEN
jgi:hypothetical protein